MSGMNEFLAAYYQTGPTSPQTTGEEVEKQAQIELFSKLAADNNIDLESLSDEQVGQLWADFQKNASAAPTDATKIAEEEEKKEEAKKEHEEKKAAAEKLAEADFLGRVVAHAYVNELKKIAAASGAEAEIPSPDADDIKEAAASEFAAIKEAAGGLSGLGEAAAARLSKKDVKSLGSAAKKRLSSLPKGSGQAVGDQSVRSSALPKHVEMGRKIKEKAKSTFESGKKKVEDTAAHLRRGNRQAYLAGGAAAGAAGGYAAGRKKESSALDELAAEQAVIKAAEAGFDADEAAEKIAALLTLGASEENSKVAQVADVDSAIEVRSLELLEQVGYPVRWTE